MSSAFNEFAPGVDPTPGDGTTSSLHGRARQLLGYLEALQRLRYPPNLDGLSGQVALAPGLPDHAAVRLHPTEEVLLEVDRLDPPDPPPVPEGLAPWVEWTEPDQQPTLHHDAAATGHDALRHAFDRWLEGPWAVWRAGADPVLTARRLFDQLYDHRLTAEQTLATHETVWVNGMAIGPAASGGTARLALFVTPVRYEIDSRTGALRVVATGPAVLEVDAFERLVDTFDLIKTIAAELTAPPADDGVGSGGTTDSDDAGGVDDPGPGLSQGEVLERLAKVIADARHLPDAPAIPAPADHWQIADLEGLFHRQRPVHYEAYFQALGRALDAGYLPDTWSAIVADEPTTAPLSTTTGVAGTPWTALDERILSPLPLNEQQRSILTRIARTAGVTVQGPPGTGKSYAIAALTSHFLTHGLRVLICAEKPQPLRVIREKMPEELRELCVAVLGDDRSSQQQLEASIAAITARVNAVDLDRDQRRLDEIDHHLDQIRRRLAELRTQELDIRQAEQRTLRIDGRELGVAEAARAVAAHRDEHGWIPDRLTPDMPLPLDDDELDELIRLTHHLAPADRLAHGPPLCPAGQLVDAAALTSSWHRLDQAAATVDSVGAEVHVRAVADLGPDGLAAVLDEVRRYRDLVAWAGGTMWAPVHEATSASAAQRRRWRDLIVLMAEEAAAATSIGVHLAAHAMAVPDEIDGRDIQPLLDELRHRFINGKGLPRLGGGELKKLVEATTIDGRRPSSIDDLELIDAYRNRSTHRRRLATLWANETGPLGLPPLDTGRPEDDFQTVYQQSLDTLLAIPDAGTDLAARLAPLLALQPELGTVDGIDEIERQLTSAAAEFERRSISQWLDDYQRYFDHNAPNAHGTVRALQLALGSRDGAGWQAALDETRRLEHLGPQLARHAHLTTRLGIIAPHLADRYRQGAPAYDGRQVRAAWRWRQLHHWVDGIVGLGDLATLSAEIVEAERQEQRLVAEIVSRKAWLQMAGHTTGAQRSALETWAQAMRRIGKGTGKHAARHRLVARDAMQRAQNAVPVWIMSIARAIESFRPGEHTPFDVVIIDEASQAPLDAIAVLGLGQRVLVVGDDKQISPTGFSDQAEADRLRRQYLLDVPDADGFDIRTSLYDTATRRFPGVIQLQEHFRCLPEIIAFSNDLAYDGRIDPLREHHHDPAWEPVQAVRVAGGYRDGKINPAEVDAIVDLVRDLIDDPALAPGPDYDDGATIGIVSMVGTEQANAIQSRIITAIPIEEIEARRIRIGSPYEFQGDERDIIIISMVDAPGANGRMSGVAVTSTEGQQRYNVAASRARDRLIVVHSFDPGLLSEADLRRRLVAFAQNPIRAAQVTAELRDRCESNFERDILERLLPLGLRVDAQYPVAGYRIDFTLTDVRGRRVAIECDGDSFHGIDQLRADTARQRILERLGWRFARIRASEFYADPDRAVAALLARARDHGLQLPDL